MSILNELVLGFSVALSWQNLALCFVGCLIGTLIGVLPGLGPGAALSILLPITAYLDPTGALIMLAGIFYGAQYGGSTTAILVNMPGESSSLVTCFDGYQMARKGRAGAALAIAALGSFFAGTVCTLLIAVSSQPMAKLALAIGAPEYFCLMLLGMTGAVIFARGSSVKAIGMALLGIGLGFIGTDTNTGGFRYTFNVLDLSDGIGFVPIVLGMLGVTEIISNLEQRNNDAGHISVVGKLWPTREEFKKAWPAAIRGTAIGAIFGVLPGMGATLASYASYAVEKQISRNPKEFGTGAVQGLAGPESSNNAAAQTSFIPMLTLGIPSGTIMALMIGALMIQGIQPGPRMMTTQPDLFWGVVASMWIGNAMLLVINLPLVGIWVKFLSIPYELLFPCIILICAIGGYSLNNSSFDIAMTGLFAIFGYAIRKIGCEVAPLAIGFILGPMLEENFRRSMVLSGGDPGIFVQSPICIGILVLLLVLVGAMTLPKLRQTKEVALQEVEE